MILLDTNVVSEPMRPNGSAAVLAWLDRQAAETLYLSTTSLAELLLGVELLPAGRRRDGLSAGLKQLLERLCAGRILPFDVRAAETYALMAGLARGAGQALSFADGQIAAIAEVHGLMVATRDVGPFLAVGVKVVNPWDESPSAT